MHPLSYGYLQPDNTDTGDVVFPSMQSNIAQLNAHNHDGVASALVKNTTQNILFPAWVAVGGSGGLYAQTIVMPAGFLYDERLIMFRLDTGEPISPQVDRVNATSYKVTVNDNSLNLVAYYG